MVVCGPPEQAPQQLPWRAFGSPQPDTTNGLTQPTPSADSAFSAARDYFGHTAYWTAPATSPCHAMKRNLSDSEGDDGFDDVSSKGTPTQSNESCQMLNRKKRRGIIEKRRRDRINNSLTELRRLVPTAFEKQGSAKLEKAEILQMTVDHLKMLHAKGFDAFSFDPHKFAMDYHSVGFRECAAEVARYLVTVEGMDIQDPLRLRLMSHLQCYSAQRELAAKQAVHTSPWNAFSTVPSSNSSQYPSSAAGTAPPSMLPPGPSHTSIHGPTSVGHGPHGLNDQSLSLHPGSLSCSEHSRLSDSGHSSSLGVGQIPPHMRIPHTSVQSASMPSVTSSTVPASGPMMHSLGQMHPQYPMSLNINTHGFTSMSPSGYSPTSTTSQAGHSVKPYRPWGAELAY